VYTAVEGPFYNCVLTSYCDKGEAEKFVWGPHHAPILGKVDCQAGARVDPNLGAGAAKETVRKAAQAKHANDNSMTIVGRG
jgi:hypothetical protein